jgi:hypothetical protein
MSTKKHLIEVRSNTNFNLDYEKFSLVPQVELILLMQEPEYRIVKKGGKEYIEKHYALCEFRCHTSLSGLNQMIGQMQEVAAGLQRVEQLGVGLNSVIEQAKKTEPKP